MKIYGGKCVNCGKQLTGKQEKYCSKSCGNHRKNVPLEHICENSGCSKVFIRKKANQRFCCKECASYTADMVVAKELALNRPFTPDTANIIRMWYNNGKGDSKEAIAKLLGRSLENIERAFV